MIPPRETESSFVDLQSRIRALSSVTCDLQIAIRTNQTVNTIPLGLQRPFENQRKLMLLWLLLKYISSTIRDFRGGGCGPPVEESDHVHLLKGWRSGPVWSSATLYFYSTSEVNIVLFIPQNPFNNFSYGSLCRFRLLIWKIINNYKIR